MGAAAAPGGMGARRARGRGVVERCSIQRSWKRECYEREPARRGRPGQAQIRASLGSSLAVTRAGDQAVESKRARVDARRK
jgi:hypothetical protein